MAGEVDLDADGNPLPPPPSQKKDRSPSFPFVTLTKAVERVREIYNAARRHEMRQADAAAAMGYGGKSSGAIQTLAALIAYGLIEDSGTGESRKFRVSDLGFKVLEDERPGARENALAQAAVSPKLIAEYAEKWGGDRPASRICISELRIDRGFTEDGANSFLRVFDDAMRYAQVEDSDKTSGTENLMGATMSDAAQLEKVPMSQAADRVLPEGFSWEEPKFEAGPEMDRFTVDEGVVKIVFPSDMSLDSVEELEQFFQLFIKKAKRRAGAEKKYDL